MSPESASTQSIEQWRPAIHFTPRRGWINDPYGVTWDGSRYHLFFQQLPGRRSWAPECQWGHAQSGDLVHWQERSPALTPQGFEVGCWSGSATMDDEGLPVLLYTRMTAQDPGIGEIALARGDAGWSRWATSAEDVVIEAPPPGLGVHAFRDPYVFRSGGQYRAIVGAGLAARTAGVLQYTSPDLSNWTFDGVLGSRSSRPEDEVWTGSVWECPQLIEVAGTWVLLVSVWDQHTLHHVAAATGDYDGRAFTARRWQRLTWGEIAYATSAFRDRDGRPCVISWLREQPAAVSEPAPAPSSSVPPAPAPWAGALSLVGVLEVTSDGGVAMTPHPDVAGLPWTDLQAQGRPGVVPHEVPPCPVEFRLEAGSAASARVTAGADCLLELVADADEGVRLVRPGLGVERVSDADGEVRVYLDADIVEVFAADRYGAYRLEARSRPERLTIATSGDVAVRAVVP